MSKPTQHNGPGGPRGGAVGGSWLVAAALVSSKSCDDSDLAFTVVLVHCKGGQMLTGRKSVPCTSKEQARSKRSTQQGTEAADLVCIV